MGSDLAFVVVQWSVEKAQYTPRPEHLHTFFDPYVQISSTLLDVHFAPLMNSVNAEQLFL